MIERKTIATSSWFHLRNKCDQSFETFVSPVRHVSAKSQCANLHSSLYYEDPSEEVVEQLEGILKLLYEI